MDTFLDPGMNDAPAPPVVLAAHAMATRFEIVLYGDDPVHLRAAGEEALSEVFRLEEQLSFYRPGSEIYCLNARAAGEPVRVTPSLIRLLQWAKRLSEATSGAFDPTVAPLLRCWGFVGGAGHPPEPAALAAAREVVGMALVEWDVDASTVRYRRPGVQLDLGSFGKGCALERAAALLLENGVSRALLHGGTSTVVALGAPPEEDGWRIALRDPEDPERILDTVCLRDASLSVSAPHGKAFEWEGRFYGHVLDPRIGVPVQGAQLAAVILPSATESDALSTGLLVLGEPGFPLLSAAWPDLRALLRTPEGTITHCWKDVESGCLAFTPKPSTNTASSG